jgi:hypothetical protein
MMQVLMGDCGFGEGEGEGSHQGPKTGFDEKPARAEWRGKRSDGGLALPGPFRRGPGSLVTLDPAAGN